MSFLFIQLLSGLANAMFLFLVASGLTLIFGVTRIVNFAHGSFYMLAAYLTYSLAAALPPGGSGFYLAILAAALATGLVGGAGRGGPAAPRVPGARAVPAPAHLRAGPGGVGRRASSSGARTTRRARARPGSAGSVAVAGQLFPTYDLAMLAVGPAGGARALGALLPHALGHAHPCRHPGPRDGRRPRRGSVASLHRRVRARLVPGRARGRPAGAACGRSPP